MAPIKTMPKNLEILNWSIKTDAKESLKASKMPPQNASFLVKITNFYLETLSADLNSLSQFIPFDILPSFVENHINKGFPTI